MSKLYYTAPSNECFEDMKACALKVWSKYEDPYKSEKIDRIKDIKNIQDNFMYILAMFDKQNQAEMGRLLKEETKKEAIYRMFDGGMLDEELPFRIQNEN